MQVETHWCDEKPECIVFATTLHLRQMVTFLSQIDSANIVKESGSNAENYSLVIIEG